MRRIVAVIVCLLAVAPVARADWEEEPLTITEGRVAGAFIGTWERPLAVVRLTMGERTVGAPPEIGPTREVCALLLDHTKRELDQGCAEGNLFVDDLFTYGEVTATIPSIVLDEFGREIATSSITVTGTWRRDPAGGCRAHDNPSYAVDVPVGYRTYTSGPVFPAAEAEGAIECAADFVEVSISSEYMGTPEGNRYGMLGVQAGETWRGPQQDLPI